MTSTESIARVTSLTVQDVFVSSDDNKLRAEVEIANNSELAHSAQVVFRGYVRKAERLQYEFLHEQVWILVQPHEAKSHEVAVDVWLPRFPPSMKICDDLEVEYSVRATVDPWFMNHHAEKVFRVHRTLVLKMPHLSCYQRHVKINKCVTHGHWHHRKCKSINGDIWIDKGAYSHGEKIKLKWQLQLDFDSKLEKVKLTLVQHIAHSNFSQQFEQSLPRIPGPDHPSFMNNSSRVVATQEIVEKKDEHSRGELLIPEHLPITMAMTLWNVLTVRYELLFEVKMEEHRNSVDFTIPIIIASEPVQPSKSSIEIDNLEVRAENEAKLSNTYATVKFTVNSIQPKELHSLRLLLQGEVRAGSDWYTFLRFKAHVSSDSTSLLSPGQHAVKISLPFKDSQYDTNILPPSMNDDIRYMPYSEIVGAYGITMQQRTFQRGKHVFVTVIGDVRGVHLSLEQQRRIRIAGLKSDESYCTERVVASADSPMDKDIWPEQWSLRIPNDIPPSIEITYWNVLALNYALKVILTSEDGHEHKHNVPIWIGCTNDNLPPPQPLRLIPKVNPKDEANHPAESAITKQIPEFEVVQNDESQEIPYWVDRYSEHMYS
ncbi:unnamed protein product [Strongylus vulgaris]|uniref:Arrestin C-terminal-like domain-containing protein n=1 Tax=Strongylus vulgaris TaxID=40348 RepID=A0A3P7JEK2_STRVU|nr:unnamed protein product [Strongylus vulgaris]